MFLSIAIVVTICAGKIVYIIYHVCLLCFILYMPLYGEFFFHIRFWYLRCCGCPGNRGRQHLARRLAIILKQGF